MDGTHGLQTLSSQRNLDAHSTAPEELKTFFKKHSSSGNANEDDILDVSDMLLPGLESIPSYQRRKALAAFDGPVEEAYCVNSSTTSSIRKEAFIIEFSSLPSSAETASGAYSIKQIPGLVYLPRLLPTMVQAELLGRLLHRDLSNPHHATNLDLHYNMPILNNQESLFSRQPDEIVHPIDSNLHKPLTIRKVLEEKLRWMTLGGQYDWTNKIYPEGRPPNFPNDIASLIHHLFPEMEPQAAIVNLYSPKDRLNMHRDVSEEIDRGLVSISIGCSCIFIIGIENDTTKKVQRLAIRLKSGDVLYMTGESRLAWHGVAKIEKGTCPDYLMAWPGSQYPEWVNWLQNKRINLNVRQMRDAELDSDGYTSTPERVRRQDESRRLQNIQEDEWQQDDETYEPDDLKISYDSP